MELSPRPTRTENAKRWTTGTGNVSNLQGLQLLGDGNYTTTQASGPVSFGAVRGQSGLGTLQDDALEASNVNISTEFSDLIIAQRAFEANAKSVTTFDTVTQDTINMVHYCRVWLGSGCRAAVGRPSIFRLWRATSINSPWPEPALSLSASSYARLRPNACAARCGRRGLRCE